MPAGTVTLREVTQSGATTKGTALTWEELDSNFLFLQSGTGAEARTVQAKLRETVSVKDFGAVGDGITDDTAALNLAFATGRNVDLVGGTYLANNLLQSTNQQQIVSSQGIARIIKNANGALFTASGNDVEIQNISFRGDAASPSFTGDNIVSTGSGFHLINCGSRWTSGRAVKSTGVGRTVIKGTCDIYQTTDATANGWDIEIGVSGTATNYHHLVDIYSSQATGGILLIDTGSHTIIGGQFGKLKIDSGTSPAGANGGKTIGARILGDVDVELSSAVFAGNQFGTVNITFAVGTSGCRFDTSNVLASGATITNNGNANNLIMREVSSGSTTNIKFGDDTATAILTINQASGEFEAPSFRIQNNKNFVIEQASGSSGATMSMSAGDTLAITNTVSGEAIQVSVTGTTSGSVIQQLVDGSAKSQVGAGGFHRINSVSADKGDNNATLSPSSSEPTNIWNTVLTADRTVTLSTTNALNGMKFRIVRTAAATGAFNLNVGTGPLKALAVGEWCEVEYNGSAWMLTAFGTL